MGSPGIGSVFTSAGSILTFTDLRLKSFCAAIFFTVAAHLIILINASDKKFDIELIVPCIFSNSTINDAQVNVLFFDENEDLITSNAEKARSVILGPGENSSFNVRSDLGDETIGQYMFFSGGDIQIG